MHPGFLQSLLPSRDRCPGEIWKMERRGRRWRRMSSVRPIFAAGGCPESVRGRSLQSANASSLFPHPLRDDDDVSGFEQQVFFALTVDGGKVIKTNALRRRAISSKNADLAARSKLCETLCQSQRIQYRGGALELISPRHPHIADHRHFEAVDLPNDHRHIWFLNICREFLDQHVAQL